MKDVVRVLAMELTEANKEAETSLAQEDSPQASEKMDWSDTPTELYPSPEYQDIRNLPAEVSAAVEQVHDRLATVASPGPRSSKTPLKQRRGLGHRHRTDSDKPKGVPRLQTSPPESAMIGGQPATPSPKRS